MSKAHAIYDFIILLLLRNDCNDAGRRSIPLESEWIALTRARGTKEITKFLIEFFSLLLYGYGTHWTPEAGPIMNCLAVPLRGTHNSNTPQKSTKIDINVSYTITYCKERSSLWPQSRTYEDAFRCISLSRLSNKHMKWPMWLLPHRLAEVIYYSEIGTKFRYNTQLVHLPST